MGYETTQVAPDAESLKERRSVTPFAEKLGRAVAHSDKQMKPFRENRKTIIKEYVGPWYGSARSESTPNQPLNMLFNVVTTLLPALVLSVRSRITAKRMEFRDFALAFQEDVNVAMQEIELDRTFRRGVLNAIFGAAEFKIGIAPDNAAPDGGGETGNILADPGKAFCEIIDLDDLILDMTARSRAEMAFVGNKYWVNFDWAMEQRDFYDRDLLERLQLNQQNNEQVRSGAVGQDDQTQDDAHLIDRVQLCDIWVPSKNMVFTIPGNPKETAGFIAEVNWEGPEKGPFVPMSLAEAPGNLMAVPVLGIIYDLYDAMNKTARKMIRRMDNRKDVLMVSEGREKDGDAVRTANDGDVVTVKDVNLQKMVTFGGTPEDGMKSVEWLNGHLNRISGNLDLVGGSGPQAGTLGQDQMNVANARLRLADWEYSVRSAAKELVKQMAWYEWNDPATKRDLAIKVPGLGIIEQEWEPSVRKGEFPSYLIDIDPYGQYAGGPQERAAKKREFVQAVIIPLEPAAQAQGLTIDVRRVVDDLANDMGIEDGAGFFTEATPPAPEGMAQPGAGAADITNETTINTGGRVGSSRPAPSPAAEPAPVPVPAQNTGQEQV